MTCFFLDTARNVVAYLETIHGLLKPGGLWINLGAFSHRKQALKLTRRLQDQLCGTSRRIETRVRSSCRSRTSRHWLARSGSSYQCVSTACLCAANVVRRLKSSTQDEREVKTCYTTNPLSMLRHEYTAAFWTARKV